MDTHDHHHAAGTTGATDGAALTRLAVSATLHCLTGCAIGEVLGMVIGTALGWSDGATIVLAVALAFLFGYSLTIAPVLRELAATLPMVRRISTYNSDSNTPMVAVNEALGFRPAGRLSTWSLRLDADDLPG